MIGWPNNWSVARQIALTCALATAPFSAAAADQLAEHSGLIGSQEREHTLIIGRVSQHPEKHLAALTKMASYLASKTWPSRHLERRCGCCIRQPRDD